MVVDLFLLKRVFERTDITANARSFEQASCAPGP
jgi:hypothetical protein